MTRSLYANTAQPSETTDRTCIYQCFMDRLGQIITVFSRKSQLHCKVQSSAIVMIFCLSVCLSVVYNANVKDKKVKLSHTCYRELGWSWSRFTGNQPADDFLSHPRRKAATTFRQVAVTFPAEERHRLSANTKLYCMVTKPHWFEQLA